MASEEIKKRVDKLRVQISELRDKYHNQNTPSVTDDVYESLTRELRKLENSYPELKLTEDPLDRVAGSVSLGFTKVRHTSRMLSLNDAFSFEEVSDWQKRIEKLLNETINEYFCELKLDGLAVSLIYTNGIFTQGATRGDGFVGEDITENLKMIKTIPLKLSGVFHKKVEVRGEVVMRKDVLKKINEENIKLGRPTFANTRNVAAGSLRQLDPQLVKDRNLDFFAWDIVDEDIKTHSEKHKMLRDFGFTVDVHEKVAKNLDEVFTHINDIGEIREKLPYGTDGVVVCVNSTTTQQTLGVVGKAPRYSVAFKYPAERATTRVLDITVNVGRTGVLTPLAHFSPVLVAGSTVSKATLHNMDQIERLDIRIGDTVVIQKAGDVIPEVVEVLLKMRAGDEKIFKMPNSCPVCQSNVVQKDIFYYCKNKKCPARNQRELIHFVNAFEIYEIGPKILDRLKEEGLITDASDLFVLEKGDLANLERFGEKSAENIINSINAHKKISLWRFIYALGILHVGEQTARDIAESFGTLQKIISSKEEEISKIENIGPVVSKSLYEFFQSKTNINFINKLIKNGVIIEKETKKSNGKFYGKIFVLTGTLPTLSREDAKKKIIENGGKVSSSVSKNTDFVLAGESAGTKLTEAKKFGVKIISESEFLKMF